MAPSTVHHADSMPDLRAQPVRDSASHPFKNSRSLLVLIPNKIDVEEESRLYDELCDVPVRPPAYSSPPESPLQRRPRPPSVFSNDIWLEDHVGENMAFARDVKISGWTSVGDKLGGAYVVYDCVIKTKEGTVIHAHKRFSDFEKLYTNLLLTLPRNLHHLVPQLPPKSALAKYRPTFLDKRRRLLEHWLAAVLLHPDIGGCKAVGRWVME
ncbi:Phox-like protein [Gloeophyllum trabeum ATCC 11539]|uniref:Endosomal/vacuolar adapter protein YPT35 n=1 Tax=Gloeophyllum trabeum (strain ATCC 11539 / FP-39264 / Madison 617) TaxID=670483 RepID=S7RQ94_GLOTA|nr:Phox-like protein [Gloeophyllum trabeum ATCC 11539]EPQ56760.1 Phox-like protein [Gloeophyllum trabeum ATCC 11539]